MQANGLLRAVSLLSAIPVVLTAQPMQYRDPVTLKPWAAPLYWQPAQANEVEHSLFVPAATSSLPSGVNALVFVAMTPCRVVDTRAGQGFAGAFGPPSLVGGASRTFPIQSSTTCAVPPAAQAYSFNITVVPPGPLGFITAYPTGQSLPLAATVNSPQGFIVGNAAIVAAGTNGSVDVYASDPTDIVIDINGYYAPVSSASFGQNTAGQNTAVGFAALQDNGGMANTAIGTGALQANTFGGANTATGASALKDNTTGDANTANGSGAMYSNTTGGNNVAMGWGALQFNTTGSNNTAIGLAALDVNATGYSNTAIGELALGNNVNGSNNIAIGAFAANNVLSNNGASNADNIHIGSAGAANDNATIRIGVPGTQISFFAAGIRGITTGNNDAIPIMIDSAGQLGTISSSRRFKEDIDDMGEASQDLLRLRPVTFRYKKPFADGSKPIQYGLIAEEVAEIYPDLVAYSADGQIETVKYQVLDSMLLNELQNEHRKIDQQGETIRQLAARLAALEQLLSSKAPPAGQ